LGLLAKSGAAGGGGAGVAGAGAEARNAPRSLLPGAAALAGVATHAAEACLAEATVGFAEASCL
jgi:hypothetical protein